MITPNDGQAKIIKAAKQWFKDPHSQQVFEYEGPAGTGKSVTANLILQELGLSKDQYMSMAYTGQAAIVMRTKGFTNAKSIHSQLYEVVPVYDREDPDDRYSKPKKKYVFRKRRFIDPHVRLMFIDEAYMVPKRMVDDIRSFGIKIIATGDPRQLPPVKDEPGFLTDMNTCYHLTELMRQSLDNPIVYLAHRIINNDPIHLGTYGTVMIIDDKDFFPEMLNYADICITGTNRTRDLLNSYVRYLHNLSNSKFPAFGERVICRNNNWNIQKQGIALANGLIGTVTSVPDQMDFDGKSFYIDFRTDIMNIDFEDINVNYEYFTGDYDHRQELKSNYKRRSYLQGELFEFAYAITTHLSQGSEHDKGIIIHEYMKQQAQRQLDYTAITRFRKSAIIVRKLGRNLRLPI